MPTWLADDPTMAYVILGLLALVLGVIWWINRGEDFGKKKLGWIRGLIARRLTLNQACAMGLTLIAFLAIAVFLLSHFAVTDHKRIVKAIEEMSAGVREKNVSKIFAHISDQFNLRGQTKSSFQPTVKFHLDNDDIVEVAAWDFETAKVDREKKEATIEFMIKPKGRLTRDVPYRCLATFVLDPDGQWRLKTFSVFEPHIDPGSGQSIYP
jgi:hypothetical protein